MTLRDYGHVPRYTNLALLVLKRRDPHPAGVSLYPTWVPLLGFCSSGTFAALAVAGWL